MHGIRARIMLLFVALLALSVPATPQDQEPASDANKRAVKNVRTDVVFLLDVSGSMRKRQGLTRARKLLVNILGKVVHPGTSVALVPFGSGVHEPMLFEVPNTPGGAETMRGEIRKSIERIRARDSYTYLFEGIQKSLEVLRKFKERNPEHGRHVILISDGKQLTRRGHRSPTLTAIIDFFEEKKFHKVDDWFIWYGHFGEPDDTLRDVLERTGAGRTISLDDLPTLNWAYSSVQPSAVKLETRKPGKWEQEFTLTANTDDGGIGKNLYFELDVSNLPRGMKLALEPSSVELTKPQTPIQLKLTCENGLAGDYSERVKLKVSSDKGVLHWVETPEIEMSLRIGEPRISVGAAVLQFGRMGAGMTATREIALIPNRDAAAMSPDVSVVVADNGNGAISLPRATIPASRRASLRVTLRVPEDAKPGKYAGTLSLSSDGIAIDPGAITVRYTVGNGRVTIGTDKVRISNIFAGQSGASTLTLTPDDIATRMGIAVNVAVSDLPEGVVAEIEPSIFVRHRSSLKLKLNVGPDVSAGEYTGRLRFTAPKGVDVVPAELPITFKVTKPAALLLPPTIDLGDVPAAAARTLKGSLEMSVAKHHDGHQLELVAMDETTSMEPRVFSLKIGKLVAPFTLKAADSKLGARSAVYQAFLLRGDRRVLIGNVSMRWNVVASTLKFEAWTNPGRISKSDRKAQAKLVVDATPDLAGKTMRLAVAFPQAAGMIVGCEPNAIKLQGGLQTIGIEWHVSDAVPGKHVGALRIGLADGLPGATVPNPVRVRLDVAGAAVQVVAVEGGLQGLKKDETRTLTVVLAATAVPVPTEVSLAIDRGDWPAWLQVELPKKVTIDAADKTVRIPLTVRSSQDAAPGAWRAKLRVTAVTKGVTVTPEVTALAASVPETVTVVKNVEVVKMKESEGSNSAMWVAIGVAAALILVLLVFFLAYRKPKIVHVNVPAPAEEPGTDDDLILEEEEDVFVFEGLDDETYE